MAAIDLEATVNQFLVLHLNAAIVDSIDRLSVPAKLEVAHAVLGHSTFKGSSAYQAMDALFDWRNAFAHDKLPGFKKNLSLQKLHLKSLRDLGVADPQQELNEMLPLIDGYLAAHRHLRAIGTQPRPFSSLLDSNHVEQAIRAIRAIKQTPFKDWAW